MRITAYRLIMAATAALAAGVLAASCSKEPVAGNDGGGGSDGGRTISVSFEGSTKTVLGDKQDDGTIPASFTASDVILVSNGSALEDCKVVIDSDGGASITTTLKGELNAVYPPEAAVYLGYNITGFKVSDSQSGRFEDAHICTATIPEGSTQAHFSNKTAILKFYVDKSIGVTSIKVTSTGADIATGSKTITVTAPRGKTLADVTDDPGKRICYVSVLPGVKASELTYETVTTTQPTLPKTPSDVVALTASKFYKAFVPYYITIGSQKWGYCNVGAFLPEEAGKYFAWGETEGRVASTTGTNAFAAKPFNWANAPFNNGSSSFDQTYFDGQKPTVCPGGVLAPEYDAAHVNWGSNWRMPEYADYYALYIASGNRYDKSANPTGTPASVGVYWCTNYKSAKGALFYDGTGELFIPIAGYGDGADGKSTNAGFYWSRRLDSTVPQGASAMSIEYDHITTQAHGTYRRYGFSIRPILNDAWWYEDLDDGGTI